ncbi:MAG TPA: glycoside hydrolase family 88 protein [Gammaproteobacteria bacterium]|nr:glycoside hydrolase family 88 protein [Gammaproteobacteria bacterium]
MSGLSRGFVAGVAGTALTLASVSPRAAVLEPIEIGLTSGGAVIGASRVEAGSSRAPTVVLVGGLGGDGASARALREAAEAYAALADAERPFALVAIPVANPERQALVFPPVGPAYRENAEAHALWRWLSLAAPDLVLIAGDDDAGLVNALSTSDVAGVAPIPARRVETGGPLLDAIPSDIGASPARLEIEARRGRTPRELAEQLAPIYGQGFDPPIYIDGMALIAHLMLGNADHVERLAEPYVDGTRDSLGGRFGVSSLVLAGHLVFAELATRTGDPRYLERARAAADLAFTDEGEMLEAMPGHGEMSDAIFMGASILAYVGELTGERRYFDMAARQIDFMNALVKRDDGLYRHSPLTDAAWSRGNGFAAIGYTLTLSKLPADHPARERLLGEYRELMRTLAGWQNEDGTWRQVIDHPGAYHETSSTAIIGFSMQRGLDRGWLAPAEFGDTVERAWQGLLARTDGDGGFIDVSESTNKQPSLEDYLMREALAGRDPRTGSFVLLFAAERGAADFD